MAAMLDIRLDRVFEGSGLLKARAIAASVEALPDSRAEEDALSRLSQWRREKTLALKHPRQRLLSAGAGMALDILLQPYGLSERTMSYSLNAHGKPSFRNAPSLCFNLSHSGSMVAAAIMESDSQTASVGIDIQQLAKFREGVARRVFSLADVQLLTSLPCGERQDRLFTRLWTEYEAKGKAEGTGITWHDAEASDTPANPDMRCYSLEIAEYYMTLCITHRQII